jgi:hypothetical protein
MIVLKRVLMFLSLAAVGACTTGQAAAPSAEPEIGAIPTVRSGADIVLPLDPYLLTDQQQRTLNAAAISIGRECMKGFGLAWPADPAALSGQPQRNDRRYALIDPEKAKTEGYHAFELDKPAAKTKSSEKPTDEAMNVWAGQGERTFGGKTVPDGGCAGEAVRKLSEGAPRADAGIGEKLQLDTYRQTKADSRIVRAFTEWGTCMHARGFDYPNPYTAAADQRWRTARPGPAEIAVASADVACKTQTNLAGRMLAVETAYQKRAIEQHRDELAAGQTLVRTQLANARGRTE